MFDVKCLTQRLTDCLLRVLFICSQAAGGVSHEGQGSIPHLDSNWKQQSLTDALLRLRFPATACVFSCKQAAGGVSHDGQCPSWTLSLPDNSQLQTLTDTLLCLCAGCWRCLT